MKFTLIFWTKTSFFVFIFFASIVAEGQENNALKKFNPVFVGINFSSDYNFRTLKNNAGGPSRDLVINSRNDNEVAKFGYTTGVNVLFNYSARVELETGIQYSNKGYKTKNTNLTFEAPNTALPIKFRSVYSYQYIGIPLKVRFTVGEGKIRFLSSIGLLTNFLLQVKQTSVLEYSDGNTEEKKQTYAADFNKLDLSPMVSIGIEYRLSDNIFFIAEPTLRYGLLKTIDAAVTENLWNVGLNLGVYRRLR